jgi:hypothetical protein
MILLLMGGKPNEKKMGQKKTRRRVGHCVNYYCRNALGVCGAVFYLGFKEILSSRIGVSERHGFKYAVIP